MKRHYPLLEKKKLTDKGFWVLNISWNKPTLKQSIEDIEKKKNIKIVNNTNFK